MSGRRHGLDGDLRVPRQTVDGQTGAKSAGPTATAAGRLDRALANVQQYRLTQPRSEAQVHIQLAGCTPSACSSTQRGRCADPPFDFGHGRQQLLDPGCRPVGLGERGAGLSNNDTVSVPSLNAGKNARGSQAALSTTAQPSWRRRSGQRAPGMATANQRARHQALELAHQPAVSVLARRQGGRQPVGTAPASPSAPPTGWTESR